MGDENENRDVFTIMSGDRVLGRIRDGEYYPYTEPHTVEDFSLGPHDVVDTLPFASPLSFDADAPTFDAADVFDADAREFVDVYDGDVINNKYYWFDYNKAFQDGLYEDATVTPDGSGLGYIFEAKIRGENINNCVVSGDNCCVITKDNVVLVFNLDEITGHSNYGGEEEYYIVTKALSSPMDYFGKIRMVRLRKQEQSVQTDDDGKTEQISFDEIMDSTTEE